MTVECLPRLTLGPPGVRFPRSWYPLPSFSEASNEMAFHDLAGREVLYRDSIHVRREDAALLDR